MCQRELKLLAVVLITLASVLPANSQRVDPKHPKGHCCGGWRWIPPEPIIPDLRQSPEKKIRKLPDNKTGWRGLVPGEFTVSDAREIYGEQGSGSEGSDYDSYYFEHENVEVQTKKSSDKIECIKVLPPSKPDPAFPRNKLDALQYYKNELGSVDAIPQQLSEHPNHVQGPLVECFFSPEPNAKLIEIRFKRANADAATGGAETGISSPKSSSVETGNNK